MESVVAYILVAVMLDEGRVGVMANPNAFDKMDDCFNARELTIANMDSWPQPNIQFLCVAADSKGMGWEIL